MASKKLLAVGITTGTYMMADFLSNFIQHPTQKMDYGIANTLLHRGIDNQWWGTRLQHILTVAPCLAVAESISHGFFSKLLKESLCFAKHPRAMVAHTFIFIATGVTIYIGVDSLYNPLHKGKRMELFKEELYHTIVGTNSAWYEPYVPVAIATVSPALAAGWMGSMLIPATLAYTTVKGLGWNDWGNSGLNDYEMKINKLEKPL